MLCEICNKNEATVHTIKYVNGSVTEQHLCHECAAKSDFAGLKGFDVFTNNDFIKDFFSVKPKNEKTCPECGYSFEDFRHSGFLGCPECYKTFRQEIIPMLRRVHGNTRHVGAAPEEASEELKLKNKLAELRKKLGEAVENEEFEEAAKLRDEINSMKKESEHGTMA